MSNQVSLKKASAFYLVGNIFNKGLAFLTVPIFTRILSTYDYGMVTTYNSWVGILSMIMGFALHMAIRTAHVDYKDKIDDFVSVSVFFVVLCSTLMIALVCIFTYFIDINASVFLIILCMIQAFSTAIITDYCHHLMMQYKYVFRTVLMILPNLISIIISILVIVLFLDQNLYMGRIVPGAIITALFGIFVTILVFRKSKVLINKEYLRYGLSISAPLIVHGIALNILSQSDRIMITWLSSASETGVYSLVYNFSMISMVIITSIEGVWIPWFIEKFKQRDIKDINKVVIGYINLMTYIMVILILIGPEIIKLLATQKYWEGINIIPPIVISNYIIFLYSLYVNVEHFHKKTQRITVNTLIAAGSNLVLNYFLIPYFGYIAAAYTTLFSYLIAFILHAIYTRKLEKDIYPFKLFIRPLLHIIVSTIIFYLVINTFWIRWIIVLIYVGVMVYFERHRILNFFPSLKERFSK